MTADRGGARYQRRHQRRLAAPETEDDLLNVALSGTAAQVEKIVRGWRRANRLADQADDRRRHETRSLRTWVDEPLSDRESTGLRKLATDEFGQNAGPSQTTAAMHLKCLAASARPCPARRGTSAGMIRPPSRQTASAESAARRMLAFDCMADQRRPMGFASEWTILNGMVRAIIGTITTLLAGVRMLTTSNETWFDMISDGSCSHVGWLCSSS